MERLYTRSSQGSGTMSAREGSFQEAGGEDGSEAVSSVQDDCWIHQLTAAVAARTQSTPAPS